MDDFKPFIAKVATGASLSRDEARDAFDTILSGGVTNAQAAAFLMALRVRGETTEEITGAVGAMRGKMLTVEAPPTPSTSSARAGIPRAPTTSRRWPRSSPPPAACRSPSMATAPPPPRPAPPTC